MILVTPFYQIGNGKLQFHFCERFYKSGVLDGSGFGKSMRMGAVGMQKKSFIVFAEYNLNFLAMDFFL